jgi:hypothetical protein
MGAAGLRSLATLARNDHVDFTASALGADQPFPPFENRHRGAVALCLFDGIGLDLVAASSAPHD